MTFVFSLDNDWISHKLSTNQGMLFSSFYMTFLSPSPWPSGRQATFRKNWSNQRRKIRGSWSAGARHLQAALVLCNYYSCSLLGYPNHVRLLLNHPTVGYWHYLWVKSSTFLRTCHSASRWQQQPSTWQFLLPWGDKWTDLDVCYGWPGCLLWSKPLQDAHSTTIWL